MQGLVPPPRPAAFQVHQPYWLASSRVFLSRGKLSSALAGGKGIVGDEVGSRERERDLGLEEGKGGVRSTIGIDGSEGFCRLSSDLEMGLARSV